MNIALLGYGHMGQRIELLAKELGFNVPVVLDIENNQNGAGITASALKDIDVAIDFSHPKATPIHAEKLLELNIPVVVGTTGWLDDPDWVKSLCREHNGRLIYGSNFSLGVQLFIKLTARAGELFGKSSIFSAGLHEVHHTKKVDAPSGTAKTMADAWLKGAGSSQKISYEVPQNPDSAEKEFQVSSQRIGSVYGEHQLKINSLYDDIELTHRARSRDAFAAGALQAASWLTRQQPGFYLIEDVIEDVLTA
ncbi:MAG: 4-hydroxy-tetrahydrodipicolinate reductase [Balneolales bacterium]